MNNKRLFDFGLALLAAIVLLLPISTLVYVMLILSGERRLIVWQLRVGCNRDFYILKFPTLRAGEISGDDGSGIAPSDPRITRIGHFLRVLHLDELPQLINVLLGHMSLVGPRPIPRRMFEARCEVLPCYSRRATIRPGLTGPAQIAVYGGRNLTPREELALDLQYKANQSIHGDVEILQQTLDVIYGKKLN